MVCRRFHLVRDEHDGVNPPGIVAEGIRFSCGKVVINWSTKPNSIITYDTLTDVLAVQSQNKVTRLVWIDQETDRPTIPTAASTHLSSLRSNLNQLLGDTRVQVDAESASRAVRIEMAVQD